MNERQIEIDGVSLAYRESGRGEPLVLVHANLSDMRSWESLEPLLADQFRVISYSRRFAHPNPPAGRDARDALPQHADDLIAIVEMLRLGKVHLVGNSSGAFVCLLAAQRRPDLARTLTLEEPPVVSMFLQTLPPTPRELFALLFSSPGALLALLAFGATAIGPATKAFERGDDPAALELFARGVLGRAAFANITPRRRQQMIDNLAAHRATMLGAGLPVFTAEDASAIATPTQVLRGSDTPSFQRRINQRLAKLIPGAEDVCIPSASHLVHEDNPQAVAGAIRSFCRDHRASTQNAPGRSTRGVSLT